MSRVLGRRGIKLVPLNKKTKLCVKATVDVHTKYTTH